MGASAAATAGLAGLAGCSGILGGGGGGGPKGVVREYVAAANNANAQKANGLLHPDGSATELTSQQMSVFENAELTVQSIEVLEQSSSRADLSVTLKLSAGATSTTNTVQWQVRKHQGEWRVYSRSLG